MKYIVILLVISFVIFGLTTSAHAEEQKQFHEGYVEWIGSCFMVGSDVVLRVTDHDMNRDPELVEEINVTMWSDNDDRNVAYALTETGKDTGIFDANVFFTTGDSSPGKRLRIVDGSIIYAKYVDYTSPKTYNAVDVINSVATGLSVLERNTDGRISKITYDPCALDLLMQNPDMFEQIDVFYPPPLKQFKSGINFHNVQCKEGLELVYKKADDTSACVMLATEIELVVRGWGEDNRLLLGCTPTRYEKCYPSDPLEYRKALYDYYFDETSLPSSGFFDFASLHTINACSDQSICFGEFDNGTKIRVSCDYPIHGCGVKSFDDYKVENEN